MKLVSQMMCLVQQCGTVVVLLLVEQMCVSTEVARRQQGHIAQELYNCQASTRPHRTGALQLPGFNKAISHRSSTIARRQQGHITQELYNCHASTRPYRTGALQLPGVYKAISHISSTIARRQQCHVAH